METVVTRLQCKCCPSPCPGFPCVTGWPCLFVAPVYQFTISGITAKPGFGCDGCPLVNGTYKLIFHNPGAQGDSFCNWSAATGLFACPATLPITWLLRPVNPPLNVQLWFNFTRGGLFTPDYEAPAFNLLGPTVMTLNTGGSLFFHCNNVPTSVTVTPLGTPFNWCNCQYGSGSGSTGGAGAATGSGSGSTGSGAGDSGMMVRRPEVLDPQPVDPPWVCEFEDRGPPVERAACACEDKHVRICNHPDRQWEFCTRGYVRGSPYPACSICKGDPDNLVRLGYKFAAE